MAATISSSERWSSKPEQGKANGAVDAQGIVEHRLRACAGGDGELVFCADSRSRQVVRTARSEVRAGARTAACVLRSDARGDDRMGRSRTQRAYRDLHDRL